VLRNYDLLQGGGSCLKIVVDWFAQNGKNSDLRFISEFSISSDGRFSLDSLFNQHFFATALLTKTEKKGESEEGSATTQQSSNNTSVDEMEVAKFRDCSEEDSDDYSDTVSVDSDQNKIEDKIIRLMKKFLSLWAQLA
jgi:hypothetical protein